MRPVDVTIIIPSWNGKDLLAMCLASVLSQTYRRFATIVVDNGSTDGTIEFLQFAFPKVQTIALSKNYGFAKAVNTGITKTHTPYIALLNNDTQVDRHWLKILKEHLARHDDYMAVCGKMLRTHSPKIIDNAGDCVNSIGQADGRGSGEQDVGQYEKIEEVFSVSGGASLWRRLVFEKVGLFDERFFAFFEDVDMGFRMRGQGFRCVYIPTAICYHERSTTALRNKAHMMFLHYRNTWMLVAKQFPLSSLFRRGRFWRMPIVYLRTAKHLITLGFFQEVLAVQWALLSIVPLLLFERLTKRRAGTISFHYIEPWLTEKRISLPWKKQD